MSKHIVSDVVAVCRPCSGEGATAGALVGNIASNLVAAYKVPKCKKRTSEISIEAWFQQLKTKDHEGDEAVVCNPCHAKVTNLWRMFGKNPPPPAFSELATKDVDAFWQDPARGGKELIAFGRRSIAAKKIEEESTSTNTAYKPLGVWEKLGYDTKLMEEQNKKYIVDEEQPWLGRLYRVTLKQEANCEKRVRGDQIIVDLKIGKRKLTLSEAVEALEDNQADTSAEGVGTRSSGDVGGGSLAEVGTVRGDVGAEEDSARGDGSMSDDFSEEVSSTNAARSSDAESSSGSDEKGNKKSKGKGKKNKDNKNKGKKNKGKKDKKTVAKQKNKEALAKAVSDIIETVKAHKVDTVSNEKFITEAKQMRWRSKYL